MPRAKILIPQLELQSLYLDQGWSPARIGRKYNCDAVTVRARLKEAKIPFKSKSDAQLRYRSRASFSGTEAEKAYMLGFKYGDLNAYKPKGASKTIVVRSHTTKEDQCDVFKTLFSRYGEITTSRNSRTIQTNCYLDLSFEFLLEKYPEEMRTWLLASTERIWPFAAGYVDAEGTFGINQGKGRFKIDAYDFEILKDLKDLFAASEIRVKFRVIAKKGEDDYGWEWKRDVWRLEVNEATALERTITLLLPHLRHKKRINDASMVLQNIRSRRAHGTIK